MSEADGGIYANNPSTIAYGEIYDYNPNITKESILLISIGTGRIKLDKLATELENSGVIGWVIGANLIDVMMSATNYLYEWESSILSPNYYRLQVTIPKGLGQMDNVRDENLTMLLQEAESYIKKNDSFIDKLCEKLQ